MTLKFKKNQIEKFLNSISKINDQCIMKVEKDQVSTIVTSADNTLILYSILNHSNEFERSLNIPDLKKLNRVIDCIESDDFNLNVGPNYLEYKSPEIKFKYHLFEDDFLVPPPIKPEKINGFETSFSFELTKEDFAKINKASTFTTETNKIYFYQEDGFVKCELTDKARHNTDSFQLTVGKNYQGDELKILPVNYDSFKLINAGDVKVSVNNKFGVLLFDITQDDLKLRYILSSLTQ